MAAIQLDDENLRLIDERIGTGSYKTADDVVRAGLQLIQFTEDKDPSELRRLIAEAEDDVAAGRVYEFSEHGDLLAHVQAMANQRP